MKKTILYTILFLVVFPFITCGGELSILTENYPPFNYEQDGAIKGISTVIVNAILEDLGQQAEIEALSWNRAYELISNNPGYVLFSMARNEDREDKFRWVGPLFEAPGYYYKRRGSDVDVTTLDRIKENASVGVRENSNTHISLVADGFKHIIALESPESYYRGLYYGRIDLIISSPWNLPFRAGKYNLPAEAFERTGLKAGVGSLYIAFSKETPDTVISSWQQSLERLRKSGEFNRLMLEELEEVSLDYNVKFDLPTNEE